MEKEIKITEKVKEIVEHIQANDLGIELDDDGIADLIGGYAMDALMGDGALFTLQKKSFPTVFKFLKQDIRGEDTAIFGLGMLKELGIEPKFHPLEWTSESTILGDNLRDLFIEEMDTESLSVEQQRRFWKEFENVSVEVDRQMKNHTKYYLDMAYEFSDFVQGINEHPEMIKAQEDYEKVVNDAYVKFNAVANTVVTSIFAGKMIADKEIKIINEEPVIAQQAPVNNPIIVPPVKPIVRDENAEPRESIAPEPESMFRTIRNDNK